MRKLVRKFYECEAGAVAVDWVVLTAAVVGINVVMIISLIEDGITQNADFIDDRIEEARSF